MPGETFSFNEATGQRTTDKGYQSAGAIAAGQSIEEVGGGICQVSSTLFNAVARADLEIVSRSPHAWPSTYVGIGEDATVNWPNLDFKFKNNTGSPVFVITYYKDRQMSAEIWGMSLGEGVSINLESVVVQTTEPPEDSKYVFNPELEYGTSERTVKARTGYKVETWQVWYENGVETRRELLHTSTYRPYQQVIEYNW
jgi:vancomycin resistance protein YoaR